MISAVIASILFIHRMQYYRSRLKRPVICDVCYSDKHSRRKCRKVCMYVYTPMYKFTVCMYTGAGTINRSIDYFKCHYH